MDFAQRITGFFLARSGRATTLSAADQHYLLELEHAGVPFDVLVQGVEAAFAAKREPPRSLSECKRWITAARKAAGAAETGAESGGAAPPGATTQAASAPPSGPSLRERILDRMRSMAETTAHPPVRRALEELHTEFAELLGEAPVPDPTLLVALEPVLIAKLIDAASPAQRSEWRAPEHRDDDWEPDSALRQRVRAYYDLPEILHARVLDPHGTR